MKECAKLRRIFLKSNKTPWSCLLQHRGGKGVYQKYHFTMWQRVYQNYHSNVAVETRLIALLSQRFINILAQIAYSKAVMF